MLAFFIPASHSWCFLTAPLAVSFTCITRVMLFTCNAIHCLLPASWAMPIPATLLLKLFCSYVFLFIALCSRWDEIPGHRQGWRCRGLCAIALWMYSLLFCSSRMRCLHCKYFAWWTGGCAGGSLLMYAQTNEHHLHSYVLLFLCLFYLSLCVLVGIVLSLRWDPWSWPGMTVSGALVVFSGCLLVFKTEEHKNKRGHWKSNVHSSELDVPLLFQCICIIDAECSTLFVEKEQNKRVYSLLFRSLRLRWMCA